MLWRVTGWSICKGSAMMGAWNVHVFLWRSKKSLVFTFIFQCKYLVNKVLYWTLILLPLLCLYWWCFCLVLLVLFSSSGVLVILYLGVYFFSSLFTFQYKWKKMKELQWIFMMMNQLFHFRWQRSSREVWNVWLGSSYSLLRLIFLIPFIITCRDIVRYAERWSMAFQPFVK